MIFTTHVVKLRLYEPDIWNALRRGDTVTVSLKHTGYRDGTEAELICGKVDSLVVNQEVPHDSSRPLT